MAKVEVDIATLEKVAGLEMKKLRKENTKLRGQIASLKANQDLYVKAHQQFYMIYQNLLIAVEEAASIIDIHRDCGY